MSLLAKRESPCISFKHCNMTNQFSLALSRRCPDTGHILRTQPRLSVACYARWARWAKGGKPASILMSPTRKNLSKTVKLATVDLATSAWIINNLTQGIILYVSLGDSFQSTSKQNNSSVRKPRKTSATFFTQPSNTQLHPLYDFHQLSNIYGYIQLNKSVIL